MSYQSLQDAIHRAMIYDPPEPPHDPPRRIQLRRTKGWRKPEGAIVVARPSKWGNPCRWYDMPWLDPMTMEITPCHPADARGIAVEAFKVMLDNPASRKINRYPDNEEIRTALRGHDLACWCPLDQPCHADVLLRLANPVLIVCRTCYGADHCCPVCHGAGWWKG